jgi:cytochrome c peroxidase
MKANLLPSLVSVAALTTLLNSNANADVTTPAPVAAVTVDASGVAPFAVISNTANQVWSLERSSNQRDWSPVATLKIHNGQGRHALQNAPIGAVEYLRAFYDPTRQDNVHDVTNALLLPGVPFNYAAPALPASFAVNPIAGQDNMPATNLTTDAGAQLGRVLFYDKRLSTNQSISCSSCHQQAHGFSDPRPFSVGFNGGLTGRNSMGLGNARWYQRRHFFWDERATNLEAQVLMPIQNSVEMGMDLTTLTNRLAAEPYYTNLFAATFGSPGVTSDRISKALAQFVRSIVSVQSKYDIGVTNNFANFTQQENQGRQIFNGPAGGCAACHGTDNFVPGPALNNNGLEFPYVDLGVGGITGNPADNGKFKVPSLRNIALTGPYMHDGRFTTLEQVVEFYNSGVVDNPNLSPPLRTVPPAPPGPRRLNLTQQQKDALVAFLRTLTDPNLATDPKLSDPFNYSDYAGD